MEILLAGAAVFTKMFFVKPARRLSLLVAYSNYWNERPAERETTRLRHLPASKRVFNSRRDGLMQSGSRWLVLPTERETGFNCSTIRPIDSSRLWMMMD